MILGIGTDILNIRTISPSVENIDDPFVRKIYTAKELQLINSRDLPLYCYATRFAGKEAVFKCFGIHGDALRLNEIEILENDVGQPIVSLYGKAAIIAMQMGITKIMLSLSYDTDYVSAYATAISD